LEMTDQQVRDFCSRHDEFVVEADQELKHWGIPGLPPIACNGGNNALNIVVKDAITGAPVPGVTIYAMGAGPAYRSRTDASGRALLEHSDRRLTMLTVFPSATYWSRVLRDFNCQNTLEVSVKALLSNGAYNWGHRLMGFHQVTGFWKGTGIRVGLVSSG